MSKALSYKDDVEKPLHDLIAIMENKIDREWPDKYGHIESAKTTFSMWMKVVDITYKTILFIGRSKLESDLNKLELCVSIPILTRVIYDTLFNVIYISDDFDRRSLDFWKSGWKDSVKSAEATERYFKEYTSTEEIISFRAKEKEVLDTHRQIAEISDEEERNIEKIRWPLARNIVKKVRDENAKEFLTFLYDCYQQRLGALSHLTWLGLAERAFFFEDIVDREQRREKLKAFRSIWLWLTITLLLALLSEINTVFDFGCNQKLLELWFIFKKDSVETAKFYDMRYSQLLKQGN